MTKFLFKTEPSVYTRIITPMKKRIVLFFSLLVVALVTFHCQDEDENKKINSIVQSIKQRYAPDNRTGIFSITTERGFKSLLVKGEVDNEHAKDELIYSLFKEYTNIIDSVTLLPEKELGEYTWGIVTVSVMNMRTDPKESAELCSQALMGTVLRIWKKKGGWYYIQSQDKYLGWADGDQFFRCVKKNAEEWNTAQKVFVTTLHDVVREQPSAKSASVCDIVGGSVLKKISVNGAWTQVALGDGQLGFIPTSSAIEYAQWGKTLRPITENLERTGKSLMGVPYLWGGTSVKGMDCSGFTRTVYLLNGLQLSRDASQQAYEGIDIPPGKEFENLCEGDLLFFGKRAEGEKPERITHVGMYLGNKIFIHSSGKVKLSSFDPTSKYYDEYNLKRFVRIRRVMPNLQKMEEVAVK